jgi:malic enzyme
MATIWPGISTYALQDTNEVLFYLLVSDHVAEMLPIVYAPTVGLACQQLSHTYRRSRGLFLSYPHQDRLGAGSAGIGVAGMLRRQITADGIPDAEARSRFYLLDINGLLTQDRSDRGLGHRLRRSAPGRGIVWPSCSPASCSA